MKRSEFYAMFITMIVLFTTSVSFAVSYQPYIIQPTKPYQKSVTLVSCTTGTYYTVIDTISGSGSVDFIYGAMSSGTNNQLKYKLTIDGSEYSVSGPMAESTSNYTSGLYAYDSSADKANTITLLYNSKIYFKSSLKIEVMQNSGGDANLRVTVNYALE